ncbi:MAG TPA: polyprenyl synthetase family protein [Kofleriaceae bacterium]
MTAAADALGAARRFLAPELRAFDARWAEALAAEAAYLAPTDHALLGAGKRLRPIVLLLAARAASGSPATDGAVRAAVALELMHAASLIHDDIVDRAPRRRGAPSVHAARGLEVALLLGDLQLLQALRCFAVALETPRELALVRDVLDAGFLLCTGELDELIAPRARPAGAAAIRARYVHGIDRKTGALFALAGELGAALGGRDGAVRGALGRYGTHLGRAFQLVDDLADFAPAVRTGKRPLADLRAGRATLPIALAAAAARPRSAVRRCLAAAPRARSGALLAAAADEITASTAFAHCYADARGFALEAVRALDDVPPGDARAILAALAHELADRGPWEAS